MIHSLDRQALARACADMGLPAYRAGQIWQWLYVKFADSPHAMTDLPQQLRTKLAEAFEFSPCRMPAAPALRDSCGTAKLLLELCDGERIETALIPAGDRLTVCVSTQVGCAYACAFCASGRGGLKRNLETAEIAGQALAAARDAGRRPSHVVFMGIGEPFANYENTLAAARIINDASGLKIAARRITISTCGLPDGIERFAGEKTQFELSVSLHAPDDELRSRLMPVNRKYGLKQLLAACKHYTALTGRIITFEYTLIHGVNDSAEHAEKLGRLLAAFPCRVNIIPLSATPDFLFSPAPPAAVRRFQEILTAAGINATVRRSRGAGINAACGQLRASRGTEP